MSKLKSLDNFSDQYPKEVRDLIAIILKEGFLLTLVGGAVRDFFLNREISKDLDFEIRKIEHFEGDEWLSKISSLAQKLSVDYSYNVEKLAFNILRIKVLEFEVELSSPRLEEFPESGSLGHSDFSPIFISNLSYEDSYKRRDFTLNAIGVEFLSNDKFKLIDPYSGVSDLNGKTLQYISDDFFKDPVRYLRTLRFKVKLGLELSRELKDNIVYFKLEKLSLFYFLQEGRKIGLEKMVFEMNFSRRKFAVELPKWASEFSMIDSSLLNNISSASDLLIGHGKNLEIDNESIKKLALDLNIRKSLPNSLITLRGLSKFDFSKAKTLIKGSLFEKISSSVELNSLVLARSLKTKSSKELLSEFLSDEFIAFIFCELEGQELFEKLKKDVIPKQRSMLGIYCHISSI